MIFIVEKKEKKTGDDRSFFIRTKYIKT